MFIFSSRLVFPEAEVLIQVERQQHRRLLRRQFVTSDYNRDRYHGPVWVGSGSVLYLPSSLDR